jgi:hypothetical protein
MKETYSGAPGFGNVGQLAEDEVDGQGFGHEEDFLLLARGLR